MRVKDKHGFYLTSTYRLKIEPSRLIDVGHGCDGRTVGGVRDVMGNRYSRRLEMLLPTKKN